VSAKDQALSLRSRANRRGLRISKRGDTFRVHAGGDVVCSGSERDIAAYIESQPTCEGGPGRIHPLYTLPPEWQTAVDDWVGWLKLASMSPNSIRLRYDNVRVLARRSATQRPGDVTLGVLVKFCGAQDWSKETRRGVRTSLVSFFDYCVRNGVSDGNPAMELPKVPMDSPRPRPVTAEVWRDLIATAAPRELLMARLAGEAGLRRGEVARCHRDDLIADPRGPSLIVHGKGQKQRVVPITDSLAEAIRDFCSAGFVFPGKTGGHLSEAYVGTMLSDMMPDGCTMHMLRHFFASRAYRGSRNLRAVQMLLGHQSIATTERYCAVDDFEIRAAMEAAGA
jgi:integrase